jgi:Condensation domain
VTGSALSLNEQWLWLIERLTPGSIGRTTATLGRRIRGPLDLDRLNRCVTELVRRHETLRTTFVVQDGHLRRVVSPDPAPGWIWRDFSDEPASEREARALAFMDEERKKQIDITAGPQTRCMIARISEHEHLMLFATHHLAADAASLVLLEEELSGLYAADAGDGPPAAIELAPYAGYIEWQQQTLRANPQESVSHWAKMIDEAERLKLDSVLGRSVRPAEPGYTMTVVPQGHEDRQQVILGPELTARVHDLATASRCSLFMILVAGLQLVLHLRSGSESFLIRTPTANRARRQHQGLIGAVETQTFVKCETVPTRTFNDVLAAVRSQVLAGLRFQAVPMSMILGSTLQSGIPASQSVACGGGTIQFALFAHGRMANWPSALDVIVCAGGRIGLSTDFQVFAMEEGKRLDGAAPGIVLEANNPAGAYRPADVAEFLTAYKDVLAAVTADPDLAIAALATRFPPLSEPAAEPASTSAAGAAPAHQVRAQAIERQLLDIARQACANETLTSAQSLVGTPDTAVETIVKLVDAINGSPDTAGLNVTITDLLEQPTVAELASSLAGRLPPEAEPVLVG